MQEIFILNSSDFQRKTVHLAPVQPDFKYIIIRYCDFDDKRNFNVSVNYLCGENANHVCFRFSMLFEAGYEPPSKKSCPSPRPGPSLDQAPLDCTKNTDNNGADLRIRQVKSFTLFTLGNLQTLGSFQKKIFERERCKDITMKIEKDDIDEGKKPDIVLLRCMIVLSYIACVCICFYVGNEFGSPVVIESGRVRTNYVCDT